MSENVNEGSIGSISSRRETSSDDILLYNRLNNEVDDLNEDCNGSGQNLDIPPGELIINTEATFVSFFKVFKDGSPKIHLVMAIRLEVSNSVSRYGGNEVDLSQVVELCLEGCRLDVSFLEKL